MILTARVVDIHDKTQFTDETERVTLFIYEADAGFNRIRIKNHGFPENLVLGEEIGFSFEDWKGEAAEHKTKSMPQLAKEIADRGQAGRFTSGEGV